MGDDLVHLEVGRHVIEELARWFALKPGYELLGLRLESGVQTGEVPYEHPSRPAAAARSAPALPAQSRLAVSTRSVYNGHTGPATRPRMVTAPLTNSPAALLGHSGQHLAPEPQRTLARPRSPGRGPGLPRYIPSPAGMRGAAGQEFLRRNSFLRLTARFEPVAWRIPAGRNLRRRGPASLGCPGFRRSPK